MTTATLETMEVNAVETIEAAALAPQGQATATATTSEEWTPTTEFFLAGSARFTVHNAKGEHYTYRIDRKDNRLGGSIWFISVLSGPDNDADDSYRYLGVVRADGTIKTTNKSQGAENTRSFKVAAWALKMVWQGKSLPEGYGINHAGCCGRCGRTLTRPEGIDPKGYRFGFGPVCWEKVTEERELRELRAARAAAYRKPTAEERMAEAVARLEAEMRHKALAAEAAAISEARKLKAAIEQHNNRVRQVERYRGLDVERKERVNREMIEEQEEQMGGNPLY